MPDKILGDKDQSNKKNNLLEKIEPFDIKTAWNENINKRKRNVDSDSNESNTSSVKRRKGFQDKISSIIYNKDVIPQSETSNMSTPMDAMDTNCQRKDKENHLQENFREIDFTKNQEEEKNVEYEKIQEPKQHDTNEEEKDLPLQKKLSVSKTKTYQCDMCFKICKNERALDKHLENKHSSTSKKISSEEFHKCQKCDNLSEQPISNQKKDSDGINVKDNDRPNSEEIPPKPEFKRNQNRRKQKLVNEPVSSAFPVSDIRVRQQASESPTLIHSSKLSKNYECIKRS